MSVGLHLFSIPTSTNLFSAAIMESNPVGLLYYPASSAGPSAIETATARFSSTTGEGTRSTSASYSQAIPAQSVSAAVRAPAWQAAMAACST